MHSGQGRKTEQKGVLMEGKGNGKGKGKGNVRGVHSGFVFMFVC